MNQTFTYLNVDKSQALEKLNTWTDFMTTAFAIFDLGRSVIKLWTAKSMIVL